MKKNYFSWLFVFIMVFGFGPSAVRADFYVISGGRKVKNMVVVAKKGGQFTNIQDAVDSITDASALNDYLVVVGPGFYSSGVTLKPHVHLQGAGQDVTYITSDVSTGLTPTQGTVILDSYTSVRDLSIWNTGDGTCNIALLALDGTYPAVVSDVSATHAWFSGGGDNYGVLLEGSGTTVTLKNVTALGNLATNTNCGLYVHYATCQLDGGTFSGVDGNMGHGIINTSGILNAMGITATGKDGTSSSYGFQSLGAGSVTNITQSILEGESKSVSQSGGDVTITHTRLIGAVFGTVDCVCVSEGSNFYAETCP